MIKYFGPYHLGVIVGFVCSIIYQAFFALGDGGFIPTLIAFFIVWFIITVARVAAERWLGYAEVVIGRRDTQTALMYAQVHATLATVPDERE